MRTSDTPTGTPQDDARDRSEHQRESRAGPSASLRHRRRLQQEVAVRALLAILVLAFSEVASREGVKEPIRALALGGLVINLPYWLAARGGRWLRLQAHVRMLLDVAMVTVGLYYAGGLAAAPYLGIYAIVPLYAGLTLSSRASLVAAAAASLSYLVVGLLQHAGWLPATAPAPPDGWRIAAFNLLVLNAIAFLTALFARAYRQSREQLLLANRHLEEAHDRLMRFNQEVERSARLRALGEVVAGMTHELRNLVTGLLGQTQLALAKLSTAPDATKTHLERIASLSEAAARVLHMSLDAARRTPRKKTEIFVPAVVDWILRLKAYDLRRDGIHVSRDIPSDFPPLIAEPFQLEQILLNLVANAQDALRGRSERRAIEIAGRVRAETAIIDVSDTGPGIAAAVLERLFEPFVTSKDEGTGLGLAICAGVARDLGGALTAFNRPDGGAVFRLTLPVVHRQGAARAEPEPRPGSRSS